ncbi:MAG: hypothetical protein ACREOS_09490 [Candidatus Dormibacteraceae bacterium]
MRGNHFTTMTPEQRGAMNAKALLAKKARAAVRATSPLRKDFADAHEWEQLASRYGVRLPPWGEPPTVALMIRFLHRLKVSIDECGDWSGWSGRDGLKKWIESNPLWPARAWAGLLLEDVDRRDTTARLLADPTYGDPLLPPHSGRCARGWVIFEDAS